MNFYQALGWGLIVVVALGVHWYVRALRRAHEREAAQARVALEWPQTLSPLEDDAVEAPRRTGLDFGDDTAPAVLSMPFGLDDSEPRPGKRDATRRRPH